MTARRVNLFFILVAALALAVRIYSLDIPFVEPFNSVSRQAMCASVARNFYRHGFNLFYPEIDFNGSGPSLYNAEFPLYSYFMALGYKLGGGVREGVARTVSVFFSMLFLFFLYRLMRAVGGARAALWATLFAALSPMSVALSRSIQPDMTMLAGMTGAIYGFYRYLETSRWRYYWLSVGLLFFAVLTKAFSLILVIPLAFMAWIFQGREALRKPSNIVYLGIVGLSLVWYIYMWHIGRTQELRYQPFQYAPDALKENFHYLELFSPAYLVFPLKVLVWHLLTPIGVLFFLAGVLRSLGEAGRWPRNRIEAFFLVWLGSILLYLLLLWPTAVSHSYYQLPLLPVAAYYVARGVEWVGERPGLGWRILRHPAAVGILVFAHILYLAHFYRLLYHVPEEGRDIVRAGRWVDSVVPQDSLIVTAYTKGPIHLYYSDRRGWDFNSDGEPPVLIQRLEGHRARGAAYLAVIDRKRFNDQDDFRKYVQARFPIWKEEGRWTIYDLRRGFPSPA